MHSLFLKATTLLGSCSLLGLAIASHLHPKAVTLPSSADMQRLFGSRFSENAAVYFPNSPQFENLVRQFYAIRCRFNATCFVLYQPRDRR